MPRFDFQPGSSSLDTYWYWINERHRIWYKRQLGQKRPWTEDWIFKTFKFTNVFRQLDRGTIALMDMLKSRYPLLYRTDVAPPGHDVLIEVMRNIWIYRLFNLDIHAKEFGFIDDLEAYKEYIRGRKRRGEKIFTSAHMTTASGMSVDKAELYLEACEEAWEYAETISIESMEAAFHDLREYKCLGGFTAYEIVCDMRFIPGLLYDAPDVLSWANMGPGAKRGLTRLGLPCRNQKEAVQSMQRLWDMAPEFLQDHIRPHHPRASSSVPYPPFELREIEHTLCEFDKYERVRTGAGRPRERFYGHAEPENSVSSEEDNESKES